MNTAPTMSKRLVAIMASILITGGISYTANAETKVDNSITSKVETSYENKATEENGIYKINVKTLKIENDEDSMAGGYIEKEVKYTKEKGKTYCEVKLLATDWMKNIKIKVDGKEVEHTIKDIGKTTVFGMEHEGGIIKFQVDSMESNLEFNMYVVPMTSDVKFRVIPQKETLEKIGDVENEEEPATKPSHSEGAEGDGDVASNTKDDSIEPENNKPNEHIDTSKEENPNSYKEHSEQKSTEENGIYKINVKTLKIENDEDSMAGGYIEKEVKYTKEKGKTYCEVKLLATDWMKNIKIKVDGKEVEHTITDIGKTTVFGMEHEGGIIKFQVDSMESNLEFNMYVVPMTSDVKFRVIPQKETLEKIGDVENEEEPATKPSHSEGNDDGNITGDVNNDSKDDLTEPEDDLTKPKEDKPTEDIDNSKEENPNSDKTDKEDGKDKLEESKKYEIKHQVYSENKEDLVVINKYLDNKSQIKIKDDGIYLSLKFSNLPSLNNLKIFIDGKEVNFHVEEVQYAPMLLAVRGTSSPIKIDMPNNNKIVTFKVANSKDLNELKGLKDKLKVQLHDDGLKKDINFNVGINESALNDVIKENGQSDSPVKPTNTSSSNENSGAASGGGSSSTGGSVEKNNISEVSYKVLKENNDEPSMAGEYIKKVEYETKNGKKQLIVHLNRLDWMKNIKAIVDGKEITPKTIITSTNNKGEKNGKLIFDINDLNSKIKLKMNVEPMGNARVTFRLDLSNKSTNPTNNNKTTNKTTGGKSNNNKETSKENKITEENGLYEISGKALKENSNEPSMVGTYIEKVNYEVKDGKKQLIVNLNRLDWMKNIKAVVDGKEVTPKISEVTKNDKGEERGKIIFPINSLDSDIKLQMNVEPMGNSRVTFRLDLDKNTLKNINKDKNTASNSSSSNKTDKDKKVNENKEAPKENNKEIEKGGNNSTNESKYKVENLINKNVESNHKLYDISFKALKENSDEPSMAGEYIKKVNYEEKDGKKYLIVDLDRIDWMKNIKVIVDGKESTPVITDIVKNSKGEESGTITFEIGNLDSQVMLTMNVVPMGNAKVRYRLVVDKNTLKEIPLSELKSKVSSGDIRKTSNTSNNTAKSNSKVLSKKKLPQTGCPVDTVKMSVIGGILASLGFILRRKK